MNIHDNGILQVKWRVGRGITRRTIYAMVGSDPNAADVLIGMMDEPRDAAHIVEVHNATLEKADPPPPRCEESNGSTGIRCYRTDDHEIHEGYWVSQKLWIRWPAPNPQTAKMIDGKPIAVCDMCSRYTDKIEQFGELCKWVRFGNRVCTGRFYVPPKPS